MCSITAIFDGFWPDGLIDELLINNSTEPAVINLFNDYPGLIAVTIAIMYIKQTVVCFYLVLLNKSCDLLLKIWLNSDP